MSMWEPFTETARRAVVMAQEIAQRAGHNYIGTEHLACALAEGDSDAGRLLGKALDRAAIESNWTKEYVGQEMVFSPGAKNAIEKSFENARRLGDNFMGAKHLALGILDSTDPPPLSPGVDMAVLRTALSAIAESPNMAEKWRQVSGDTAPLAVPRSIERMLAGTHDLARSGTRMTLSIAPPDRPEYRWVWDRQNEKGTDVE